MQVIYIQTHTLEVTFPYLSRLEHRQDTKKQEEKGRDSLHHNHVLFDHYFHLLLTLYTVFMLPLRHTPNHWPKRVLEGGISFPILSVTLARKLSLELQ